jgi:hypothetical protein
VRAVDWRCVAARSRSCAPGHVFPSIRLSSQSATHVTSNWTPCSHSRGEAASNSIMVLYCCLRLEVAYLLVCCLAFLGCAVCSISNALQCERSRVLSHVTHALIRHIRKHHPQLQTAVL